MKKPRGILAWFATNHVAANLLMLFIFALGLLTLLQSTVEVFPELILDSITVQVPYRGASPEEVEEGVCIKVEEAIASIEGIKRIQSTASEGTGSIVAQIEEDADRRTVLDDIKAAVDRIDTFPSETLKPIVSASQSRRDVITVAVYGDADERTLKALAEQVRDDLTAIDGISQVDINGIRSAEISVELSEDSLQRHNLTFDQVADAMRQSSLDIPGGSIKTAGGEILLRTKGQLYKGEEFEDIVVITQADGTQLRLGDIARVIDGFDESEVASRYDGQPAAMVQVFRVGSQGALDVAEKVRDYVESHGVAMPAGVKLETWQDNSKVLNSRLSLLLRNARTGLILVFLSLALFLDLRLAFWTTLAIPLSFVGAFWFLPSADVTINMISLFAFIIVLGIVVDDAIVVGENVYSYREKGMKPYDAAIRGVQEMAAPVTFAVLTTIAAFLPLAFVDGVMGKIMRAIPVVVVSVLIISLMESMFILPSHLTGKVRTGPPGPIARTQTMVRKLLERFVNGPYKSQLELALKYRYVTIAIGFAMMMFTTGLVRGGFVKFTFMPKVDSDNMIAALTMPQGTPLAETQRIVEQLEGAARKLQQEFDIQRPADAPSVVQHISTTIGAQPRTNGEGHPGQSAGGTGLSSAHLAEVNVELRGSEDRGVPSLELVNRWRQLVGEVPGAVALTFNASLFGSGNPIEIEFAHDKTEVLERITDDFKDVVKEYPGVFDVADTFLPGKRELKLALTDHGRTLGLTLNNLARQVRQAFYGEEVQRIQRNREDVRVMLRYPLDRRTSMADIEQMRIRTPAGVEVPFSAVARVQDGRGYATIRRTDRRRVVSVTGDVDEAVANANEINADLKKNHVPEILAKTPGLVVNYEGQQREQADAMKSLRSNFFMALLAIFALLAVPFKSYLQPLIVMSAIPFGIIGAILGHVVMGMDMSLMSMFGLVALSGVVVNDSLVMVDLINRERQAGIPMRQAIRDSGVRRFRPIMLTTLTTFFGLVPMLLEKSVQAKFLVPMAVSLAFGVVSATGITLLLVPCLYAILEDIKRLMGRLGLGSGGEDVMG